jgi:hypothetical protein
MTILDIQNLELEQNDNTRRSKHGTRMTILDVQNMGLNRMTILGVQNMGLE